MLREIGTEREEAAGTLGASPWQSLLAHHAPRDPAVAYGVVLTTARALGEYGAVGVVSGRSWWAVPRPRPSTWRTAFSRST